MLIIKDTYEWLNSVSKPCSTKEELLSKIKDVRGWLDEELKEYEEAVINDDVPEQLNAIIDAQWILSNLPFLGNLKTDDLLVESVKVRKSNFSKFCETEEEAIESVKAYSEGVHPNKMGIKIETYYKPTGHTEYPYVILRKKDGKILKSINFKDVHEYDYLERLRITLFSDSPTITVYHPPYMLDDGSKINFDNVKEVIIRMIVTGGRDITGPVSYIFRLPEERKHYLITVFGISWSNDHKQFFDNRKNPDIDMTYQEITLGRDFSGDIKFIGEVVKVKFSSEEIRKYQLSSSEESELIVFIQSNNYYETRNW